MMWVIDKLRFAFGSALPLILGIIGLATVLLDLFGALPIPPDWTQEILLAAASVVLLSYFTSHSASLRATDQFKTTSADISRLCGLVEAERGDVRQVPASEIRSALMGNLHDASAFYFRGGSGRWLRNVTLPTLAAVSDREIALTVQLVDPRDEHLCHAYADYRSVARRGPSRREGEGNPRLIQRDILAAVYLAAYYSANARLTATVVLTRNFSPLRYDVSDRGMVVSVADETKPGLVAASGTWLHDSVVDEMKQARHGSETVNFGKLRDAFTVRLDQVTEDSVYRALSSFTVVDPRDGERATPLLAQFSDAASIDWKRLVHEHVRSGS